MKTPWRLLVLIAAALAIGNAVVWLLMGYSLETSILFGLVVGPGWLVLLTLLALAGRALKSD